MTSPNTHSAAYSKAYLKRELGFCELLTPDGYNPKTKKGRARGYATAILHLAPHKLSMPFGGGNNCSNASPGCIRSCLNLAGHGGINLDSAGLNAVQRARIARSVAMRQRRFEFKQALVEAIQAHIRRARRKGLVPVVRLNGTSDIAWEKYRLNDGRTVFETFPEITFYDYTKDVDRALANARGEHPANYQITFSRSETNELDCERVLRAGGNVAIVANICECKRPCKHEFPEGLTYHGRPVINGDHDDLRFLDPSGVVVGLKAKGPAKVDASGFVLPLAAFEFDQARAA
jgi:hypothetical protein